MNLKNHKKLLRQKLIQNLLPNSILATDNAPCHNKQVNPALTSNSRSVVTSFLKQKSTPFEEEMLKPYL
jgi:hypothetical protein